MKQKIFKLLALILIVLCSVLAWYWMEYNTFLKSPLNFPVSKSISKGINNTEEVKFTIKPGSNLTQIANQLYQQQIITKPKYFKLYVRLEGKSAKIQAGEYIIKSSYPVEDLLNIFIKGEVTRYQLTIPEGWTAKQILGYLKKTDLVQTINDEELSKIKQLFNIKNIEGYIFPSTYFFLKGEMDQVFLKRSIKKMQTVLENEWQKRDKNLPLKSSYEALILASIVEKESGQKSERSKIAGVFIRRLRKGMRLQSDPTIIYGMGDSYKGNIRRRDINKKTLYNTYQIKGLPPTPIASPGQDAIHAVLHPDSGKSLYFVADGSGGHKFSNSLKEHNKAVRKFILKK
jgi:UPF0755 protein